MERTLAAGARPRAARGGHSLRLRAGGDGPLPTQHPEDVEQLVKTERRLATLQVVHEHQSTAGQPRQLLLRDVERLATPAHHDPELESGSLGLLLHHRGSSWLPVLVEPTCTEWLNGVGV